MSQITTLTNYDANANAFDYYRQPNPIIVEILKKAFTENEFPILSIGCGTGQYENILSKNISMMGLDKSMGMMEKAKQRIQHVALGDMTSLPFVSHSFSGAYFMQSLHHVGANVDIHKSDRDFARKRALKEAIRVVDRGPIFIVQRDPAQNQAVWFWKYFPRALEVKMMIQPKISLLVEWLNRFGLDQVTAEAIHDPMIRGFYNPSAPLDPGFRRSFSEFSYLSEEDVQMGVRKLQVAINDGSVLEDIAMSKLRFTELGGTVFVVSGTII
jgi:SAM-dependent methyltransferase